jgi:hypothetical protein
VHETVDSAVEPDENAKVGYRLDLAGNLVATVEGRSKLGPWIRLALLDAQGNTAALFVNLEPNLLWVDSERFSNLRFILTCLSSKLQIPARVIALQ